MKKYISVWWKLLIAALQPAFVSRFGVALFLLGKILRFGSFIFFIVIIGSQTKLLGTYNLWQMILFFLSFNLIDTTAQFLFREVYRFRQYVLSGEFDYMLLKPMSALFRALVGGSDMMDIPMLFIIIIAISYTIRQIGPISIWGISVYILLLLNALMIALALHILILCLGVVSTEVDNAVMFYRDLTQMGRVPIDIYRQPLRSILTFVIPVGIMMTIPAKALIGLISWQNVIISFLLGNFLLLISFRLWRRALQSYASASS